MKRYWMIVAVGFAFSILSTGVSFFVKAVHAPPAASYVCAQLLWPGMEITSRWFVSDPIGHILTTWLLIVAFNALIYSVVFGAVFWLFGTLASRRKHRISN